MNLDHLRYFVKLAEVRHYTRAAEQLCISQPSLSHAINQLESELGVPLFERTGRNTTLTRFGEEFLECAQRSLGALDVGIDSLQRSAKGEGIVRLGFLRTLRGFPRRRPRLRDTVQLSFRAVRRAYRRFTSAKIRPCVLLGA